MGLMGPLSWRLLASEAVQINDQTEASPEVAVKDWHALNRSHAIPISG